MAHQKQLNINRKLMVGIPLLFLLSLLMVLLLTQHKGTSLDLEDSAIYRRFSLDSDSLFIQNDTKMDLPCTKELNISDGTVQGIISRLNVTNDYVSLVRINLVFIDDNLPDNSEQSNPSVWHWGLGGRGKTLLHFPYDNKSLSLNTLSFGFHWVNVTIDNTGALNESYSDGCLGYTLSKVLRQVRRQLKNTGGASQDVKDDVLCKERYLSSPLFGATLIPGYSLFDLQSSSYYECWNIMNIETCDQDNCLVYPSFTIGCTIVTISFGITYILLLLALIWELWRIYSRNFNYQDEGSGESVNILRINLIPPVLLMLASNNTRHHKMFNMTYWALVYAVPFIIYFVAFLWYATRVDEYAYRSFQRGEMFTRTNAWGLDFGLANILYIDGAVVFLYFIYKYRLSDNGTQGQFIEEQYNWKSKKTRVLYYIAVVIFCFFRFSATAMLLVEIIVLTSIGIAINIRYGSPVWINIILGAFFFVANIIQFFDSYQHLFSKIHSVGTKVDRDDSLQNKIFQQTGDGSPQLQFTIESSLLRDIIRKWLPLYSHVFNTIKHIIIGIVFLVIVALIVVFIDRTTHVSSFVEYVVTTVPLVIAAAGRLGGSSLTAGGKAKNSTQDKLMKLEKDLREYAQTGEFPLPEASCGQSFYRWLSCLMCCISEPDQQDPNQGQTQNQDPAAPAGSINQSTDPSEHSVPGNGHDDQPPTSVASVSLPQGSSKTAQSSL
nr:uncharacterized protein LOC129262369 [Lytechinus pictus]XP_054756453.1 uncharacterized protein LOC129262369 [Lytechinus pictus]